MAPKAGDADRIPGAADGRVIRVMTVDDHPVYRDGLAALLALHNDFELVAEAGDGREAIELFRHHRPDVTLMDLSMPVMGGAEAIGRITSEFRDAKIIALTTYEGDAD
ncbi:MAG TPA: response regulator transcription factor, partial [Gemmatimonadaceae bacterium]|nr:response regulator transcription factor [Gemmatimonadaceae bacterium]